MPPLRGTGFDPEAEHPEYAGKYRLEARLGAGGMGVVHLARSPSGLQLAVKIVHRQHAADPEFRARFRQEVAAARRVSGAFTAPVVDADPTAALPWMATLYVPGPTLSEQVKRNGPLAPAELRRLTAGLAEALRDIHRAGVIHRDLKPSNVLLSDSGPKVIDFGISRPYDSDLRTETGKLIGSPPYMAPEQFQRPREVGPAADVFALGAVLVHASTGRGPFDSDSPYIVAYQVVHDEADLAGVPADLSPLVARCLAKDPAERPTPDEIMAALALQPPSYEASAFIPAQRRAAPVRGPVQTLVPGSGAGSGAETSTHVRAVGAVSGSRSGSGFAQRWTGRGRRSRWAAAGAVLLVLGTAGTVGLWGGDGSADRSVRAGSAARRAAPAAFVPWVTPLPSAGGATPVCSGADRGLYCGAAGFGTALLDPVDGRVIWSRPAPSGESPSVGVLSDGVVHASDPGERLRVYDADKGGELWDLDLSAYLGVPFSAGDTLLMTRENGTAEGLDGRTGKSRWARQVPGHLRPDYALYDEDSRIAYAFEHAADGATTLVTALEAATGRTAWQHRLDGTLTPVGAPGGALVLAAMNAAAQTVGLVRYEPARTAVTRLALPFRMNEPEVVMGGDTAYLLARDGTLLAMDTGRPGDTTAGGGKAELWRLATAAGRTSRPVLAGGNRLCFSAADGRLLAVDTEHGTLLGQTRPRLRAGKLTYASTLPAPVALGRTVYGMAPDGSVFAVDGRGPTEW
ncbi:PQQ-binding-like beta-propeller repeat protein [Streptomyces finlayi]|uniref:PQQ-binding-like beta-propeller repeat protein n=1 Tax=Streptomyces finlayi TaxID=67296 RepID=A0A7G7BMW4_9ACTN|nr:serine/threonine-protein kinase [Streptomyces finlayi]QNE76679.1 PQQ-binding-like beta-propeller repeat protein [Streptomyces finlayi]